MISILLTPVFVLASFIVYPFDMYDNWRYENCAGKGGVLVNKFPIDECRKSENGTIILLPGEYMRLDIDKLNL